MTKPDDIWDTMMNAKNAVDRQMLEQQKNAAQVNAMDAQARVFDRALGRISGGAAGGRVSNASMGVYPYNGAIGNPVRMPMAPETLSDKIYDLINYVRHMEDRMTAMHHKVERLSGFYHWVTEVHPELAAQYKAMRDLYDAANREGSEGVQTPKEA